MNASLLEPNSVEEQFLSLRTLVRELRQEVGELRRENAQLRQEVTELRTQVGYWKSMHARAVERNVKLQAELDQAQAEIRQLKAERFGKQSEKRSTTDRSNHLEDPQENKPKRKRGQQPDKPAPKRRDYSHLPPREQLVDLPDDAKVCDGCGSPNTFTPMNRDGEFSWKKRGKSGISGGSGCSPAKTRSSICWTRAAVMMCRNRTSIARRKAC